MTVEPPPVAISSCLLGERVRYDGRDSFMPELIHNLEEELKLVSLCPEVAIGLGIPRPPMRLVNQDKQIRVVGVEDGHQDFTARLLGYGTDIANETQGLSGYVFKSRSPSCGLKTTPIYSPSGTVVPDQKPGSGIVAATIIKLLPELPVEDELRLMDPLIRRDFIEDVKQYAARTWKK